MTTIVRPEHAEYVQAAPGVHLFCRSAGHPGATMPVLMLHGNRDNHAHYAALQELLAHAGWHSVAVDWRGHGMSSTLDCTPRPELLAQDVSAVIDHFGWEQVVLVGHSLGSVAAMTFADMWPERVAATVLMGTAATFTLPFRRPEKPVTRESWPEFVREANVRAFPVFFHECHPETARRICAAWANIPFEVHQQLVTLNHPDMREVVRRLRAPALVIAGEHDRCTPPDAAAWIRENHRDAELAIIPSTAHFMYVEEPRLVAREIDAFLTSRLLRSCTSAA
jgi:pimeloyl-ACP methyl ester carboxylesterase